MKYILVIILLILILHTKRKWGYAEVPFRMTDLVYKFSIRKLPYMYQLITPMNKEIAIEGLGKIHSVFNKFNIPFHLSEGTALGFIREGNIIDYDDDVDIGIMVEYKKRLYDDIIPELEKNNFKVTFSKYNFISLEYKGIDYDIDILEPGKLSTSINDKSDVILPYLKDLNKITIDNKKYDIPNNSYLEKMYGSTWRIPRIRDKPISVIGQFKLLKDHFVVN